MQTVQSKTFGAARICASTQVATNAVVYDVDLFHGGLLIFIFFRRFRLNCVRASSLDIVRLELCNRNVDLTTLVRITHFIFLVIALCGRVIWNFNLLGGIRGAWWLELRLTLIILRQVFHERHMGLSHYFWLLNIQTVHYLTTINQVF